ncbi:hypothetical protein HDV05_002962, partial [Chytridiales sp. JEL 0842]
MMPKVATQLALRFERPIPEIYDHQARLRLITKKMRTKLIENFVGRVIPIVYNFQKADYANTAAILETSKPSDAIIKLLQELHKLGTEAEGLLDVKDLLSSVVLRILNGLMEGRVTPPALKKVSLTMKTPVSIWETERGPRRFGFGGVQQLVLDIHFLLQFLDAFITEESNQLANGICEKALRTYFTQNPNVTAALKGGE